MYRTILTFRPIIRKCSRNRHFSTDNISVESVNNKLDIFMAECKHTNINTFYKVTGMSVVGVSVSLFGKDSINTRIDDVNKSLTDKINDVKDNVKQSETQIQHSINTSESRIQASLDKIETYLYK